MYFIQMPSFRLSFISLPKRLQPFQALLQQCCIDGQIQSDKAGAAFSKGNAALDLKAKLGKKVLVCVGDAENDLAMLDAAD